MGFGERKASIRRHSQKAKTMVTLQRKLLPHCWFVIYLPGASDDLPQDVCEMFSFTSFRSSILSVDAPRQNIHSLEALSSLHLPFNYRIDKLPYGLQAGLLCLALFVIHFL